ncbi:response regulator [Desulfonatronospira sp.]|uniref:response regulator n=1 Tax=Desulfonatronospira sp. TaxID=1962951 RepID=UPI0025B88BDF|nr:response regulator [Desulfonatronospira sp.]
MSQSTSAQPVLSRQKPSGRVLIIDDDPDFVMIVERILKSAGHLVLTAHTGRAGLELIRREMVDVVLLDVNLPDHNGLDICSQIKNNPDTMGCQVLFLSGTKTSSLEQARGLKAGAQGYMVKSISKEELLARVEAAIHLKDTEDALRFERSQLLSIFNSIDELIYVLDPYTYEILFANQFMKDQFQQDLVGKICYQVLHNKEAPCEFCTNDIILNNEGMPYQWEHYNPVLEKHLLITDRMIKWPDGRDARFEFAVDITRRKTAEEALEKSEERFKQAMDATHDGIWDWDVTTGDAYFSPGYTNMLGYSAQEFLPGFQSWLDHVHPDDKETTLVPIKECLENRREFFETEFRMRTRNNNWRWILGRGKAVARDEDGRATRMIGTHTDITERKLAEEKLLETNKKLKALTMKANDLAMQAEAASQAKSDFLANMSHEIRTPLNGVIGMTNLLLDTDMTQEQRRHAETIQSSGEALLDLINDILDFSKIEAGRLELKNVDFSLHKQIHEVLSLMQHSACEKGLKLHNITDESVPERLRGDPGRLRQILVNLINNAIKFTDAGRIEVHTSLVSTGQNDVKVHFAVRDTGIGIPEGKLDYLFEKFSQVDPSSTRKYGGTGLGLAISRNLARMMGGEIGAISKEGQGSEFWFTAILEKSFHSADEVTLPDNAERKDSHTPLSGHVLVVEDTVVNQKVALGILKKLGLTADIANNGYEAIHALQNMSYDLVLMDVMMPEMDGLEATRRIRSMEQGEWSRGRGSEIGSRRSEIGGRRSEVGGRTSEIGDRQSDVGGRTSDNNIPIIAMTAGAMQQDLERCLEAGMDDYVTKPVNPDEMGRLLSRWLKADRSQREVGYQKSYMRNLEEKDRTLQSEAKNGKRETPSGFVCSKPVFDKDTFLLRMGDDRELAEEILNIYMESLPENIRSLKDLIKQGHIEAATRQAHSIKGNSANTGCLAMAEIALAMEEAGHSGVLEQMKDYLPELERQFELCREEIEKKMKPDLS